MTDLEKIAVGITGELLYILTSNFTAGSDRAKLNQAMKRFGGTPSNYALNLRAAIRAGVDGMPSRWWCGGAGTCKAKVL
jgi:hypothetical protein